MNNQYNITFSVNREHLLFACITLYSLIKSNQEYYFNVYMLNNNSLKQEEITKISKQYPLNQYDNFKIHLVNVSHLEILKKLPNLSQYPSEIYFKLFAHLVLPNVDKLLHLDTDVFVIGSIKELFDIDMHSIYFAGDKNQHKKGVCAGVLMINLAELRKQDVIEDMEREFLLDNQLTEENFFNRVYKNHIKIITKNYIYTLPREDKVSEEITKIIHFTTIKPYVLQRFKFKDLSAKKIKDYLLYLEDFIEPKYKYRFKLLKLYIFYFGSITNSLERRIKNFWHKNISKRKEFYFKSNIWTNKIYKYSYIKKK